MELRLEFEILDFIIMEQKYRTKTFAYFSEALDKVTNDKLTDKDKSDLQKALSKDLEPINKAISDYELVEKLQRQYEEYILDFTLREIKEDAKAIYSIFYKSRGIECNTILSPKDAHWKGLLYKDGIKLTLGLNIIQN